MYAQTIIQLLNQATREGYAPDDVALMAQAYRFSLPLFSGRFRISGKTFFAHLVGTASVLASVRAEAALVIAGLLHAAYTHGDFGTHPAGMTAEKRAGVRAAVGDRVEAYVARYTSFEWSARSLPDIATAGDRLDGTDRPIVMMRLANELDDYLDLGMLYEGGDRQRVDEYVERTSSFVLQIARRVGCPQLASGLTRVFAETRAGAIASGTVVDALTGESFVVLPTSSQMLTDAVARRVSKSPALT